MFYSTGGKQALDAIFDAFKSFVQKQNYFNIFYSPKVGYLRILVDSPEEGAIVLDTPEVMLEYLCSDLICDIVYSLDNPKRSENDLFLTEYEKMESCRRLTEIFQVFGVDERCRANLANQYIKKYQGDTRPSLRHEKTE